MTNQSLTNLIGWGLMAAIIAGLILLFSSCTVPRLAGPTVDDLAGCPMVMFDVEFEEPPCDHFYIKQAHTITDTIQAGLEYQACICIYCKDLNVCK